MVPDYSSYSLKQLLAEGDSLGRELVTKERRLKEERQRQIERQRRLKKAGVKFGISGAAGIVGLLASPFTFGVSAFAVLLPFGLLAWDGIDLHRDVADMREAAARLAKLERDAWGVKERLDTLNVALSARGGRR